MFTPGEQKQLACMIAGWAIMVLLAFTIYMVFLPSNDGWFYFAPGLMSLVGIAAGGVYGRRFR